MNVEIGTEAAQFPGKEYVNGIFVAVQVMANVQVIIWYLYMYMLSVYGRNNYSDAWRTVQYLARGIFCHDIMISHLLNESSSGAM